MTIDEIRQSQENFLTPEDVAGLLEMKAQTLREQARKNPLGLPFPVLVTNTRTRIPRVGFIEFWDRCIERR